MDRSPSNNGLCIHASAPFYCPSNDDISSVASAFHLSNNFDKQLYISIKRGDGYGV